MFIVSKTNKSALAPSNPPAGGVVGFTLIELLVVIVIIGILATLTTVSLTSARGKARDARRISDLKQIATALELYQADNNSYPTLITGGNALSSADGSKVYMKKIPSDPSTNASYSYYGSTSRFTLRTTIEKSVDNIPVGPVIVTSGGGVKQAVNTDNSFMYPDLSFGALVGHWPLDAANTNNTTVYDLSGNGNNGTVYNGAYLTSGRYGEDAGAYGFDGSNDYIRVLDNDALDLNGGSQGAVSIWLMSVDGTWHGEGLSYPSYITKGSGAGWSSGSYHISAWGGSVRGVLRQSTGANVSASYSVSGLHAGVWYHFVLSWDGSFYKFYKNGNNPSAYSQYGVLANVGAAYPLNFAINGSYYANIVIADARLYSRALTPEEVSALYNATKP